MRKKLLVLLTCIPILGACSSASLGNRGELSDNQITELNGYKCMIKEGLMLREKASELIQAETKKDKENFAYFTPVLSALNDGVSKSEYERSEAQIIRSNGCKNVALAWMSVNLGTEKTAEITEKLYSKGWFEKSDSNQ